jgi:hypothetical protein
MSDAEFRDALWLRLGLPAPPGHADCTPKPPEDWLGLHRLGCRAAADWRLRRHDAIAEVIASSALAADPRAFRVAREAAVPEADSQARPGDVALDLGDGRALVDVTVANPCSEARLTASRRAGSPAFAAEQAYDRKVAKYHELLAAVPHPPAFTPLAVTALGVWDERSLRWLRRFSDTCAAATAAEPGHMFASLMTRLSVALWRGNSRMLRAAPPVSGAERSAA